MTQGRRVSASEARWAPPESQVGMVSRVYQHRHRPQGRLGRGVRFNCKDPGTRLFLCWAPVLLGRLWCRLLCP